MTKRALTTRPKDRDNEALDLRTNLQKKNKRQWYGAIDRKHIYIYHTHLTVYANIFIYCVYNVYVDMENVLDTCCKEKTTNQ